LIYSFESVDNGSINKVLSKSSVLTAQWKPDMFQASGNAPEGAVVITGKFADGTDLTAIPYYARLNRTAPGAANPPAAGAGGRGGRGGGNRFGQSAVWMGEQQ
jgi:hypothetical protein